MSNGTPDSAPPAQPNRIEATRDRRAALLYPILLLLIVIGFYWKLTLTSQFEWMWGGDLVVQVLPWFEEEGRQLQQGWLPLWDPHNWGGAPILGQGQPGAAYPLNWILFLLPRYQGHIAPIALHWYYVAIHYMAALFCYLLCRDLGRSKPAALIGGLVFSFASCVGTNDWPQMVNGAVWAPLVLLFLVRAVRGVRPAASAALSGCFLGVAWLSGHHQIPTLTTLMAGGIWLYYILLSGRPNWKLVGLAGVMFFVMFLVAAVQVLPAQEYGRLALRWAGAHQPTAWKDVVPYYVHREYSLYPMSLFAIVFPGLARNADPFIGIIGLTLVLLGVATYWKHYAVKLLFSLAVGGLVFSLGHNSVFHGFLYAVVPMVEKARVPSMAVIIFSLGAAALAAFGVDALSCDTQTAWFRRMCIGVFVFGVSIYTLLLAALFTNKLHWDADDRAALTAFIALLFAALLRAFRYATFERPLAITLLTMLLLFELANNSGYTFPHVESDTYRSAIDKVRSNGDIADFLAREPGPFRIETQTDRLVGNWGEYHNFDVIKAETATAPVNVMSTEFFTWQSRMLFGVRYTLSEKAPSPESEEVFTAATGLKIFRNPEAFPRAWTVHEIVQIPDPGEGARMVREELATLRTKALIVGIAPALPHCSEPDSVTFSAYEPERIVLKANMRCEGMVVLSDTFFPGWEAKVDGRPTRIYEVNNAMRGMVVSEGSHELVLRYRPLSVYIGAALSLLGVLSVIGLVFIGRTRA